MKYKICYIVCHFCCNCAKFRDIIFGENVMNNKNIVELSAFNSACDEFIAGKYILADLKISSILKAIAGDEKLKDIVSSCLQKYDFDSNFELSVNENENTLVLPSEEKEIISYAFSLLFHFDNKSLDFYKFVNTYFAIEDEPIGNEIVNFAKSVIVPFKNAVNSIYSKRHIIVETDDYQKNYYNKIISTIRLIIKNIDNYKLKMNEKEEFTMLLNSLYIASEKNDKKLVFSLMIALDYFSIVNKKARVAYIALEECFTK